MVKEMNIDDEINNEYKKIESEKIIGVMTLNNSKRKFAEEILTTNIGEELKNCNAYIINEKCKLKIPLKIKIRRFFEKLKIIFGYGT